MIPQVSVVETVIGEVLAMTSSPSRDGLLIYVLSRDSRKKWRITVVKGATKLRWKLILVDGIIQVENNDIEMAITMDKRYVVLKVNFILKLILICSCT